MSGVVCIRGNPHIFSAGKRRPSSPLLETIAAIFIAVQSGLSVAPENDAPGVPCSAPPSEGGSADFEQSSFFPLLELLGSSYWLYEYQGKMHEGTRAGDPVGPMTPPSAEAAPADYERVCRLLKSGQFQGFCTVGRDIEKLWARLPVAGKADASVVTASVAAPWAYLSPVAVRLLVQSDDDLARLPELTMQESSIILSLPGKLMDAFLRDFDTILMRSSDINFWQQTQPIALRYNEVPKATLYIFSQALRILFPFIRPTVHKDKISVDLDPTIFLLMVDLRRSLEAKWGLPDRRSSLKQVLEQYLARLESHLKSQGKGAQGLEQSLAKSVVEQMLKGDHPIVEVPPSTSVAAQLLATHYLAGFSGDAGIESETDRVLADWRINCNEKTSFSVAECVQARANVMKFQLANLRAHAANYPVTGASPGATESLVQFLVDKLQVESLVMSASQPKPTATLTAAEDDGAGGSALLAKYLLTGDFLGKFAWRGSAIVNIAELMRRLRDDDSSGGGMWTLHDPPAGRPHVGESVVSRRLSDGRVITLRHTPLAVDDTAVLDYLALPLPATDEQLRGCMSQAAQALRPLTEVVVQRGDDAVAFETSPVPQWKQKAGHALYSTLVHYLESSSDTFLLGLWQCALVVGYALSPEFRLPPLLKKDALSHLRALRTLVKKPDGKDKKDDCSEGWFESLPQILAEPSRLQRYLKGDPEDREKAYLAALADLSQGVVAREAQPKGRGPVADFSEAGRVPA